MTRFRIRTHGLALPNKDLIMIQKILWQELHSASNDFIGNAYSRKLAAEVAKLTRKMEAKAEAAAKALADNDGEEDRLLKN